MREGWEYKKLNEVCDKGTSNLVISKLEDNNGAYPLYGAAGVVKSIDFYHQDRPYIGIVKDGAGVGRVSIYPAKSSLVGTMQYLFPKEGYSIDFIKYFLVKLDLAKHVSGATIPHIYFKDYGKESIPIPPLSTQHSIVSELDEINNLLNLKRKELETYDKLAQSLFYEMFGDPVENEKGWEVKKLGEVCEKITDGTHKTPNYKDSGIVFLSAKNVKNGYFNYDDCKYIDEDEFVELDKRCDPRNGDIVITKSGSIGDCAILNAPFNVAFFESLALLKLRREVEPQYIRAFIRNKQVQSEYIYDKIKGIAIKHLHLTELKAMLIPLPPLPLQQLFAQRIEAIEHQKAQVKAAIEKLETLLAARMQYWFE